MKLLGTFPRSAPEAGWAFLRAGREKVEYPLTAGSPLRGKLSGWTLEEVRRGSAVFTNGARRRTLTLANP